MATCKECIHCDLCKYYIEALNEEGCGLIFDDLPDAKECGFFKPTADVVPKSEYDEVLSSWQKIHDSYDADCIEHYKYGQAEVAREIFEEIESISSDFPLYGNINTVILSERDLAFIKKKYTTSEIGLSQDVDSPDRDA